MRRPYKPGPGGLLVYDEAIELSANTHELAKKLRGPGAAKVADQMRRAADSIYATIAEGYGRGLTQDGINYFRMARASCDELESHFRASARKRMLTDEDIEPLVDHVIRVRFLIFRYADSVRRRMKEKGE